MIRVSAYPTVEWLRNRACDRNPSTSVTGKRYHPISPSAQFAFKLREVVSRHVRVAQNVWITTPDGEAEIHIVLTMGGKRIALCFSERYSTGTALSDSILLVYGRFDGLYRIEGDHSASSLNDALYALMCDRTHWFSNFGRLSIGRLVSGRALLNKELVEAHPTTLLETETVKVSKMRMCKANDWVALFEKALLTF